MTKRGKAKIIGHYSIGDTIGEGTFGKVKLGAHLTTGENVAVKILEKERIVDVADVERVAREIHILKLIRHPHIVQLYEIIETPRQLYLIMEYANGGELFDYIVANARVKEREACKFFHQIISGVAAIHENGVVHRDLKPENLLLDENGNIKIVDFGLSNTFTENQLLKTACGSPCYAAPEMIAGQKYVPSLCDIWSCGVILFAIICGFLPFEDQNTNNLYNKILQADYQLPRFVSRPARDLISGLLTTDPTKRLDINGVRKTRWYSGLIEVADAALLPPELQFLDTTSGCGNPTCARCQEWFSQGELNIDEDILTQLERFNFPRDYARNCLKMNKHNHVTTSYYLLQEKKTRLGEDFSTEKFAAFDLEVPVGAGAKDATGAKPLKYWPPEAEPVQHSQQPRQPRQPQSARQPREVEKTNASRAQSPARKAQSPALGVASEQRRPYQMDFVTPRGPVNAIVDRLYGRSNFTPRAPACPPSHRPQPRIRAERMERPASVNPHSARQQFAPSGPSRPSSGNAPRQIYINSPRQDARPSAQATPRRYGRNAKLQETPRKRVEKVAPLTARGLPAHPNPISIACLSAREPRESTMSHGRAFNVSCTTTKAPRITMQEIQRSLNLQRVTFNQKSAFSLRCHKQTIKFEVEVSHLDNLESVYVIRFKRIAGEPTQYKDLCSRLLGDMRI